MELYVSIIFVCVINFSLAQLQAQAPLSRPIKLTDLQTYIADMDSKDGFKTEFDRMGQPQKQLKPWTYAIMPQNVVKHRYPPPGDNLLTYDETRVILYRTHGDYYSDFINANWINSYKDTRMYIATQCPIDSTIGDFWRMVWQYNVHEVVMLASPHDVEKKKCAKYFPDNSTTFGEIEVSLQRRMNYPDIVVRIYAIKRGGSVRVLAHHHFVSWPDLGVPEDPKQLLNLIRKYRDSDTYTRAYPLVVHCSAGVGRTGTFLLTDAMYDMALNEDHVDFLKHLQLIRNQRISVVEKPEQYALAHRVIAEAYNQGLFRPGTSDQVRQQEYSPGSGITPRVQEVHASSLRPTESTEAQKKQRNVFIIDPNLADQDIVIRISSNENACPSSA